MMFKFFISLCVIFILFSSAMKSTFKAEVQLLENDLSTPEDEDNIIDDHEPSHHINKPHNSITELENEIEINFLEKQNLLYGAMFLRGKISAFLYRLCKGKSAHEYILSLSSNNFAFLPFQHQLNKVLFTKYAFIILEVIDRVLSDPLVAISIRKNATSEEGEAIDEEGVNGNPYSNTSRLISNSTSLEDVLSHITALFRNHTLLKPDDPFYAQFQENLNLLGTFGTGYLNTSWWNKLFICIYSILFIIGLVLFKIFNKKK